MQFNPRSALRGAGKVVAVGLAAGIGGAAIGVGLAELTGANSSSDLALTQTAPTDERASTGPARARTTTSAPAPSTTANGARTTPADGSRTTTVPAQSAPEGSRYMVPRVEVLLAQIGTPSSSTGHARVTARIRVTNRNEGPLALDGAVLVAGDDEVPLDGEARAAAGPLLESLTPGASAVGTLRFTTPTAVAQRLTEKPRARLRVAQHTVVLKLTNAPAPPSD